MTQSHIAVRLLSALLALQGAFTLLALALRPYISAVLNCIEVVCGCLDIAYMAITTAAYLHTGGHKPDHMAVSRPRIGRLLGGSQPPCQPMGRHCAGR